MASTLPAALAWAARGFRVFPLITNTNKPLWANWTELATTNEQIIRSWWSSEFVQHEYNVGVLTTNLTVLDADVKDGKTGLISYLDLGVDCDTLTVRTPSGGFHFYFSGADAPNAVQLLPGLDVRSTNGYVVAPGSTINGRDYVLEIDSPVATLPDNVRLLLEARKTRSQAAVGVAELDTPSALTAALHFLEHAAPIAIEGAGGDDTTYRVACRLRDLGLSHTTAGALLIEHWNDRCLPPWQPAELQGKVENAFTYATGAPGQATAAGLMNGVSIEAAPPPPADEVPDAFSFGNALPTSALRRRPWILSGLLLRRSVTTLISPGGIGKSTLMLVIAAHLAAGRDLFGFECRVPGKSVIYNAEDDLEEQTKRLRAVCTHYGFDFDAVASQICLLGPDQIDLQLTKTDPSNRFAIVVNQQICQQLGNFCAREDVVFCGLDPLLEIFGGDINDNPVQKLNLALARQLARSADIALMIAHHTRKPGGNTPLAGDASSSMGASAIINSARLNLTLVAATPQDCERYAIRPEERHGFLRIDSAKGNYARRDGEPIWLRRAEVGVQCGDGERETVGVLHLHDLREDLVGVGMQISRTLYAEMLAVGTASLPLSDAVTKLMLLDPICEKQTAAQVKARVENALGHGVTIEGNVRVVLKLVSGKKVIAIE